MPKRPGPAPYNNPPSRLAGDQVNMRKDVSQTTGLDQATEAARRRVLQQQPARIARENTARKTIVVPPLSSPGGRVPTPPAPPRAPKTVKHSGG